MSVCQYYLRGNCRYGTRCRLPHGDSNEPRAHYPHNSQYRPRHSGPSSHSHHPRPTINPNYNYVAPSIINNNHNARNRTTSGGGQPSKYPDVVPWITRNFSNKKKAFDILVQLQKEATVWQKSEHLWRFTSRSLFPGGHPLEGWQDQSFEEVKWAHRFMTSQDQEHVYKKSYSDYFTNTERHLVGLAKLRLDTLESLKDYINEYVASNYEPSKTLSTDIEMKDVNDNTPTNFLSAANYTPDDQLLEDERAAFERDSFEFGQIPVHAPSRQFS